MLKKRLKRESYLRTPWKNGLGITDLIEVEPPSSEKFLWRLSSATVKGRSDFSFYPGYNRLLAVIKGDGLKLNSHLLTPGQVHAFRGEEQIAGESLGPEIRDLGLIYDREKIKATMTFHSGTGLQLQEGLHYLYLVSSGDTLKLQGPAELSVEPGGVYIILIHLLDRSP